MKSDGRLGVQSTMSMIAMIPMHVVSRVLRGGDMAGWDKFSAENKFLPSGELDRMLPLRSTPLA